LSYALFDGQVPDATRMGVFLLNPSFVNVDRVRAD
jgi:hypothetical protein